MKAKDSVPISAFLALGIEVHEQMFRPDSQSDMKPPVFSSQTSLILINRPTEGRKNRVIKSGQRKRHQKKYRNDYPDLESLREKKGVVSCEDLFQATELNTELSRKLRELQVYQNLRTVIEMLDDAASVGNLTEEERQERTLPKENK
ncbi:hypothetical protein TNCV_2542071 [Trichonephila clavipes]|nr:hypothetical protein TNCV_2542071 [Trichonephila clavipes]